MLSDEQIRAHWNNYSPTKGIESFARAIEAEVRKQDDALIMQLVDLLDEATAYTSSPAWSPSMTEECKEGITAARARLGEKT